MAGRTRRFSALAALVWVFAGCNTFDDPSDGGSSGFFGADPDNFPVSPPQALPPTSNPDPSFVDTPPRVGSSGSTGGWTKVDGGALDDADAGTEGAGE